MHSYPEEKRDSRAPNSNEDNRQHPKQIETESAINWRKRQISLVSRTSRRKNSDFYKTTRMTSEKVNANRTMFQIADDTKNKNSRW
jgi:hypothetical protein